VRDVEAALGSGRIEGPSGEVSLRVPLVGRHNVYNVLAAFAAAAALGVGPSAAREAIERFAGVPGRLEAVGAGQEFRLFVDYAHTEDAIRAVLSAVRGAGAQRVISVVGCGGDRDRTKRPRMGRVAAELSDFVVVTSDNPRTEDPMKIIEEILPGIPGSATHEVEPDRAAAIRRAVERARREGFSAADAVLVLGKGHEDYQVVGTERVHFDDREVAREALEETGRDRPRR